MFNPSEHLIRLPRKSKDKATGQWTTVYEDYLEVKWRLVWFREKYPHGRITTEALVLEWEKGLAIYRATAEDGEGGQATGTGTETRKSFEDFVEKAETRAIGRALAALGIGTQFVGEELSEGGHIADAPVAQGNGHPGHEGHRQNSADVDKPPANGQGTGRLPPEARISPDDARRLKQLVQQVYGYAEGARRLRHDLGFEVDEALSLRHIAAHTTAERYAALRASYEAQLRQEAAVDVP